MNAKCPVCGSPLPKVSGNGQGCGGGGLELGKESALRKHPAQTRTPTSPASKKMEPGPSFNIKNVLNGFTYNLVPQDRQEMQSLCIIPGSVINTGIQSRFAIFQSVTNQDNSFRPHFLNSLHPPPYLLQSHKATEDGQRRGEKEKKLVCSHTPDRVY